MIVEAGTAVLQVLRRLPGQRGSCPDIQRAMRRSGPACSLGALYKAVCLLERKKHVARVDYFSAAGHLGGRPSVIYALTLAGERRATIERVNCSRLFGLT